MDTFLPYIRNIASAFVRYHYHEYKINYEYMLYSLHPINATDKMIFNAMNFVCLTMEYVNVELGMHMERRMRVFSSLQRETMLLLSHEYTTNKYI